MVPIEVVVGSAVVTIRFGVVKGLVVNLENDNKIHQLG